MAEGDFTSKYGPYVAAGISALGTWLSGRNQNQGVQYEGRPQVAFQAQDQLWQMLLGELQRAQGQRDQGPAGLPQIDLGGMGLDRTVDIPGLAFSLGNPNLSSMGTQNFFGGGQQGSSASTGAPAALPGMVNPGGAVSSGSGGGGADPVGAPFNSFGREDAASRMGYMSPGQTPPGTEGQMAFPGTKTGGPGGRYTVPETLGTDPQAPWIGSPGQPGAGDPRAREMFADANAAEARSYSRQYAGDTPNNIRELIDWLRQLGQGGEAAV